MSRGDWQDTTVEECKGLTKSVGHVQLLEKVS